MQPAMILGEAQVRGDAVQLVWQVQGPALKARERAWSQVRQVHGAVSTQVRCYVLKRWRVVALNLGCGMFGGRSGGSGGAALDGSTV